MSNEYVLEMKNISKTFPGVKALDNAYLNLKYGEVLALCGENGAGKSTLMKVLSEYIMQIRVQVRLFIKENRFVIIVLLKRKMMVLS